MRGAERRVVDFAIDSRRGPGPHLHTIKHQGLIDPLCVAERYVRERAFATLRAFTPRTVVLVGNGGRSGLRFRYGSLGVGNR